MGIATSTLHPELEILLHRYRRRSVFAHLDLYDPLIQNLQAITAPVKRDAANVAPAPAAAHIEAPIVDAPVPKLFVPMKSMVSYRVERKRFPV